MEEEIREVGWMWSKYFVYAWESQGINKIVYKWKNWDYMKLSNKDKIGEKNNGLKFVYKIVIGWVNIFKREREKKACFLPQKMNVN